MNLNKTIHTFSRNGEYFEIDWLTDVTCQPGMKICDIYKIDGKEQDCVGQIMIRDIDTKKQIEKMVIAELNLL